MSQIGYAVVGSGYFGAELGRIINEIDGARVSAIYDPYHAQPIAKELDCDVEEDLDLLFAREDVNAVIVASPNYLHKTPVLKAADHGVHVFCEKPIALSYQDCKEMVDACEQNGVKFMAGHVMNFFASVRRTKELINDGRIGRVLYGRASRTGWEEAQKQVSWKKVRAKSGGHLYHHIHELDFMQFILGTPETAYMTGGNIAHQGENFGDEEDLLLINLTFPDNRYAFLEYGSAFRYPEHYVLIQGTEGAIKIDMQEVEMTLITPGKTEKFLVHETEEEDLDRRRIYSNLHGGIMYGKPDVKPPLWLQTIMKNEMVFFNDLLKGKPVSPEFEPLVNGRAAKDVIATADACTKSLAEKRVVHLDEIISRS